MSLKKRVETYVISFPSGLNHLIFDLDPELELEADLVDLHSSLMSRPSFPVRANLFTESVGLISDERFFRNRSFYKGLGG